MENGLLGKSSHGVERVEDCSEVLALMVLDACTSVASVESLIVGFRLYFGRELATRFTDGFSVSCGKEESRISDFWPDQLLRWCCHLLGTFGMEQICEEC